MGPLLHPARSDGTTVDATFELTSTVLFEIVYHHKAGARGSDRSVNADYHEGLELVLTRLATLGCSIHGIAVDSGVARELPPEQRELDLRYPLELTERTDVKSLRLDITRAQKPVARREDAKPGGGNDQKRIRITFTSGQWINHQQMASLLTTGP
jgi:hypothetical protein